MTENSDIVVQTSWLFVASRTRRRVRYTSNSLFLESLVSRSLRTLKVSRVEDIADFIAGQTIKAGVIVIIAVDYGGGDNEP
jgi:uncharacterized protein YaiI (UPF0178 family)